jgi:hypothetical protein
MCSIILTVNSQKIDKIQYKTDKNSNIFVILLILFVKIIEHTVASYESSDFT